MKENQDKEVLYAFPQAIPDGRKGMTLRDYFAAKAMQAILNNEYQMQNLEQAVKNKMEETGGNYFELGPVLLSKKSYEFADAMLKERAYTPTT